MYKSVSQKGFVSIDGAYYIYFYILSSFQMRAGLALIFCTFYFIIYVRGGLGERRCVVCVMKFF